MGEKKKNKGSRSQGRRGDGDGQASRHRPVEISPSQERPEVNQGGSGVMCAVSIKPKVNSQVNWAIMMELGNKFRYSRLHNIFPAYDGAETIYSNRMFTSLDQFEIDFTDDQGRHRMFTVILEFIREVNLYDPELSIEQNLLTPDALQALNINLRQIPISRVHLVNRALYTRRLGTKSLGKGLESWCGFYQSFCQTQMGLSLNMGISKKTFTKSLSVIDFVSELLNRDDFSSPLLHDDRDKIKNSLRDLLIEVTHHAEKRKYRISGVTSNATKDLKFLHNVTGRMTSIVDYYKDSYNVVIKHPTLPCLQVGNQKRRERYFPMEVCNIVQDQPYSKCLNEEHLTNLRKDQSCSPKDLEEQLKEVLQLNAYRTDPYTQKFGIIVKNDLVSVKARTFSAPRLKYNDTGAQKIVCPIMGQWDMSGKRVFNGGKVKRWICICFCPDVDPNDINAFCLMLSRKCETYGMEFASNLMLPIQMAPTNRMEHTLKKCHQDAKNKIDLVIVILPDDNGSFYGDLKRICEIDLGLVSQCCLLKNVLNPSEEYLTHVSLKINVKVGGWNTVLEDAISEVDDKPTIFFGADVTHPEPGDKLTPSIAAVVASLDWPEVTKYSNSIRAQGHGEELIKDLREMVKERIDSFCHATFRIPERIIFYRDGVGDGMFNEVLQKELVEIHEACRSWKSGYQPPVTFIVVQKRHNTRFIRGDGSGNILPGTVVDTDICNPTHFNFYLCSHACVGDATSRPARYCVLKDENGFTADAIQSLTYKLCYTYARCTRSLSVVPPVHYAHLAAYRARSYLEPAADRGSRGSGDGRSGSDASGLRTLLTLKDNVKNAMLYC